MRPSSRFKLSAALSLFLIIVIGLTLLGSTRSTTHATSGFPKSFTKLNVKATCGSWSVISSPNVAGYSSILYGVAAISANNVWAVGYYQNASGTIGLTLAERWNGSKWSIVPSPNVSGAMYSILNSVVAISSNNIWAVGYYDDATNGYHTLIEHWNGVKWRIVSNPNPGSSTDVFNGVTATSGNDVWAAGYYQNPIVSDGGDPHTLIEHWNGTSWSIIPSPNPASSTSLLTGITASSLSNAWAVGYYTGGSLIEQWNGVNWNIIPSPSPGLNGSNLNSVATVSANQVRAAGSSQNTNSSQPLIENWDGTTWSIVPSPPAAGSAYNVINGITVLSANNNWAVGYFVNVSSPWYHTLTEQWNGTVWNVVPSPNIGTGHNRLTGVTHVPGTSKTWAVGYYDGATIGYQTLIEFYC